MLHTRRNGDFELRCYRRRAKPFHEIIILYFRLYVEAAEKSRKPLFLLLHRRRDFTMACRLKIPKHRVTGHRVPAEKLRARLKTATAAK